uniref:Solute carrier family 22 member 18 n=1 Tax=Spermophilus dauricus TaxID=99837 RepID=A0A8C9QQP1_SPEDA
AVGSEDTLGLPWVVPLTYVLAALELTCLFMQFSILPYLSRSLGLDSVAFGYLQTTFGVLQLLGGPLFGRYREEGDAPGFHPSIKTNKKSGPSQWGQAQPSALLGRLPLGRSGGGPCAGVRAPQAPGTRPPCLARCRAGRCFLDGAQALGPTHPATPIAPRVHCPAIVALVANLLGAIISVTCIPASTKGATVDVQAAPPGGPKASVFDLKAISRLLLLPGVLPVFLIKVVSGFPSGLFMIMFSIISMDFFQLEPSQAGYLMSFFGVLQMVVQGLVIGRLSSHFSEEALLRASVLVFMVVGLAMALMSTVLHFCFLVPGLVFSLCTLNVVTDSMLTKAVSASDTGTMLGLCASVQPLTRTLGPTLGGLLYRSFGVPIFGHVQFAVNFFLLLVLWRKPMTHKRDKAW